MAALVQIENRLGIVPRPTGDEGCMQFIQELNAAGREGWRPACILGPVRTAPRIMAPGAMAQEGLLMLFTRPVIEGIQGQAFEGVFGQGA